MFFAYAKEEIKQSNVWKICKYRPLYYLKHLIQWCENFALSVKWAHQSAKRGVAEVDWFNLCYWMIEVLAPMFDEYATNCYGYPGEIRGWTHEKWVEYASVIITYNTYIHLYGDALEEMRSIVG